MDRILQQAAEIGSIDELYALIEENPHILENIDAVPFINTPLHVAASSGNLAFAVEMMNLKPSFAKKLNTNGYSPLHLAVENDQGNLVTRMLWLDGGLARVKGRYGITPFLLLVERGNADLVAKCLDRSPECIKDVSVNHQNALHLAVMNGKLEILKVLTNWIQENNQHDAYSIEDDALNKADFNLNTPLHLAAIHNEDKAMKLLLECGWMKRNRVNGEGKTFLDIFTNQRQTTSGNVGDMELQKLVQKTWCEGADSLPKSKTHCDILKSPLNFWTFRSTYIKRETSYTSGEDRGAFLIICVLIITATYQTALQPPGGVHQSGSVVMKQGFFITLWIFNTLGFCCAMLYTYYLKPRGPLIALWFYWIEIYLCISYAVAMAVISPHPLPFFFATFAFFLLFALFIFLVIPLIEWRDGFLRRRLTAKPKRYR